MDKEVRAKVAGLEKERVQLREDVRRIDESIKRHERIIAGLKEQRFAKMRASRRVREQIHGLKGQGR